MLLAEKLAAVTNVIRRVIGAPDYELYVRHMREAHPGGAQLSKEDFARDALSRRYDRPGSRCC